jgi:hypothetical protein
MYTTCIICQMMLSIDLLLPLTDFIRISIYLYINSDTEGLTPFLVACMVPNVEIMEYLHACGANIHYISRPPPKSAARASSVDQPDTGILLTYFLSSFPLFSRLLTSL